MVGTAIDNVHANIILNVRFRIIMILMRSWEKCAGVAGDQWRSQKYKNSYTLKFQLTAV